MDIFGHARTVLAQHSSEFCLGVLADGDVQGKIKRALEVAEPGRKRRHSPLNPVLVVWLVLALPLFRALSIPNVFAHLMDAARRRLRDLSLRPVGDDALAHARERVSVEVFRRLFEDLGSEVRPEPTFHGLRVFALDATVLSVADTPANEATFGRHRSGRRGRSAFPQFRLVTLTSVATHEVRAAGWCPYGVHETVVARRLLAHLGKGDLVLLDRGLGATWLLCELERRGVKFVCRLTSRRRPRWFGVRGPGDMDGVLSSQRGPGGGRVAKMEIGVRVLSYTLDGEQIVRLAVSAGLESIPGLEVVELYHLRWEQEIAFDELKTHLSSAGSGAVDVTFRGRSAPMVEQELWATLVLYNLVRRLMARAAGLARIDPRRISFVDALEVVRLALPAVQGAPPEALIRVHVQLVTDLTECEMRRWRRPRRAPRAIKIKTQSYRHKKPGERTVKVDFLANLRFGAA